MSNRYNELSLKNKIKVDNLINNIASTPSKTTYDCRNCKHHWASAVFQESCPACGSYAVLTTDEWSLEDALEES